MAKKILTATLVLILTFAVFSACAGKKPSGDKTDTGAAPIRITVVGSTSVTPLMEEFQTAFAVKNPDISVEIQSVGSTAGIQSTIDGSADIGMSSRDLTDAEKAQGVKATAVAMDGITVIVNPSNPVDNLTKEQATKIFTGQITNWKEVGGADRPIVVVSREDGSGTRSAFEELFDVQKMVDKKGKKVRISGLAASALVAEGNGAIKSNIANKRDAVGYISLGYIDSSVKAVKIDNVEAADENIRSGSYKIARPFLVLTKGEPAGPAKDFIDFMLSSEGQQIIKENHFITVK